MIIFNMKAYSLSISSFISVLVFSFSFSISLSITAEEIWQDCSFNSPQDLLNEIRTKHPNLVANRSELNAVLSNIEIAKQRPNPELSLEAISGNTAEGKASSLRMAVTQNFELGGKYMARIQQARAFTDLRSAELQSSSEANLIDAILSLYKLRQKREMLPVYNESLGTFQSIFTKLAKRNSLSPSEQVEREMLALVISDYSFKRTQILNELKDIERHLSLYYGQTCRLNDASLPKDFQQVENFHFNDLDGSKDSKFLESKYRLSLAKANLAQENAKAYSDLRVGPSYEFERLNIVNSHRLGLQLSLDLPLWHRNQAAKNLAIQELRIAEQNMRNTDKEFKYDLQAWLEKYKTQSLALKSMPDKKKVESKHQRIESLFLRGAVPTSMVIEAHRQLIEFSNSRSEIELKSVEALWNLYRMQGVLDTNQL